MDPDLSAIPDITSCTSGSCSYDVTGLTNNSTTTIGSLLETDGEAGKSLLTAKSAHNAVPPDLNADPGFSAIHTVFWRFGTSGLSSLRYPLELLDSGGLISLPA